MKKFLITFLFLIISISVEAGHLYPEKYYQSAWCGKRQGKAEYKLKDNTRVDCLTANYAVEFDFAPKWAESFGQAKYYAKMTGKKAAVILIIEKPSDWKYYHRLKAICEENDVTLWYIKSPVYNKTNKRGNIIIVSDFIKDFQKVFKILQ